MNVDVSAFLAFLKQHEPDLAMNYVSRPHPHVRDDLTDGPDAVTIDGWWFVADLEAAIRAAIHGQIGSVPLPRPRPANYLERGEAT
ncbi:MULTISPECIES: hypothetical protein [unclassified Microbacterium]|uniref:hypothetical protein n=1 Tax=unclassified Microbacterium TaxID=2609290 RepID=UPI00300FF4DE